MLTIISGCLLLIPFTVATPFQLAVPNQLNLSCLNSTHASDLTLTNAFQCFDPSFPPPGPFYPVEYAGCRDAAITLLAHLRRDVPSTFSRSGNADFQLPWRARSGNCMISLNVHNEDDEDIMCVRDVDKSALALCRMCACGYYRYGGRTPVGPRGVVYISVHGTAPLAVEAASSATPQSSHAVARQIKTRDPGLFNTSSPAIPGMSALNTSNTEKGKCFSESHPSSRGHLYPVKTIDCLKAADELVKHGRGDVEMTFGRGAGMDFRLPWSVRSESCTLTVDTRDDADFDTLTLWKVHEATGGLIGVCTTDENIFGGSKAVGSRSIVFVYIFGSGPLLQISPPASSVPTHAVSRAQTENSELTLLNTTGPHNLTSTLKTNTSNLRGFPECFDPPLPRERSIPISNFKDCETATIEIVGSRTRIEIYIFSRKPSTDPNYYQLPATFRVGTCVVHLDMEYKNAEDVVRLSYVESTAWVLAHKCSGLENPEEKWGGTMTVSVGAQDLIRVWVYGVSPQNSERPLPSQVASLLESE